MEASTQKIKLPVYSYEGNPTGEEILLDPRVFGLERNSHVLYLAVKTEMTNRRQGTRKTKTKDEIRGGGKKPFKQKGRGGARAGSTRSPIWRGGGTMHGPQPIDFEMRLPRKVKRLARRVALSVQLQNGCVKVLSDFDFNEPKTSKIAEMLAKFETTGKSALLMLNGNIINVVKSCRNIPKMNVCDAMSASTRDILLAKSLFISKSAVEQLHAGLIDE